MSVLRKLGEKPNLFNARRVPSRGLWGLEPPGIWQQKNKKRRGREERKGKREGEERKKKIIVEPLLIFKREHVPLMFCVEGDTISNVPLTNWSNVVLFSCEICHAPVFLTILSIKLANFLELRADLQN